MKDRMEFHVERDIRIDGYVLRALVRLQHGGVGFIEPLTVRVEDESARGAYIPPTLELSQDAARNLIDELWRAGVRPSEHGSPGQLAATEGHLADMRRIAFAALERDGIDVSEATSC